MREKIVSNFLGLVELVRGKEVEGEPLDMTPGIKVSKTINPDRNYTFNEIAESVFYEKRKDYLPIKK